MEWGRSECGKYRIESLTAATMPGAFHAIKEAFFKDEPLSIATEVNINPVAIEELLELCADAALDGVSLVAVEISTGVVASALFNKLQVSTERPFFEVFVKERCTQPSAKAFSEFLADQCNMLEQYGVDCSFDHLFMATLREHRLKKLAYLLCKAAIDMGRRLKYGPVSHITLEDLGPKYGHMKPTKVTSKVPLIIQGIATSVATQKIAKALNFTTHLRVSMTEFVYGGKTYAERLGYDPYCELLAQRLD